ncbi:HIT-like domain-containing protein [Trametes punicea]|nr:HIT-like domain-containing protein [Trametes punicea]
MANLTILRTYAALDDPSGLPTAVLLCHTDFSVTVHDRYPKSYFHELVIPRVLPPLEPGDLRDLRALLRLPREQAKAVLLGLQRDSEQVRKLIEEEMVRQYGFTWPIQVGFHAVPSLVHLHLHVMSTDFLGIWYKKKKHVNSFHPRLGFFLHLDEVIRWFDPDIEPTWFAMKTSIDKKEYEALLARDPLCPHCDEQYRAVPKLRTHLFQVFDKMKEEYRARNATEVTSREQASAPQAVEAGAEKGQKRKHGESDSGKQEVIDVDALREPSPAKRQQLETIHAAS